MGSEFSGVRETVFRAVALDCLAVAFDYVFVNLYGLKLGGTDGFVVADAFVSDPVDRVDLEPSGFEGDVLADLWHDAEVQRWGELVYEPVFVFVFSGL